MLSLFLEVVVAASLAVIAAVYLEHWKEKFERKEKNGITVQEEK